MSGAFGFNKSKQKSEAQKLQEPEFAALKGPLAGLFLGLTGQKDPVTKKGVTVTPNQDPLGGLPQFSGPLVAPMTAGEQAALSGLDTGGAGRTDYLGRSLAGDYLGSNPFLDAQIAAAMRGASEEFEHTVGRVLPGQFARAGHRVQPGQSSPFDTAAALATRGYASALGDIQAKMRGEAYEGERTRQQQAAQLSQQEVEVGLQKLQAQALPRLIQDLGIERGLQEFNARSDRLMQLLQIMTGAAMPQYGQKSKGSAVGFNTSASAAPAT